jgi:Dolichyl-phosphate-mannose-protein mannosyltransferase
VGPPSGALEAGLAAVAVALGLMWLGFGLTGLIPLLRGDPVARWALAFPTVVLLALAMMIVHIASRGALFHSPEAVRAGVGLIGVGLVVRWLVTRARSAEPRAPHRDLLLAVAVSLLVALVWGSPVFRMLPVTVPGDAALHAGWAEQLVNGESTPSASLTGDIPNYYPWLYHGVLALVTHLTPGGHALVGLAPLHLIQVIGMAASLFGIGYLFAGRWAGAAVAVLGSGAGGWGFVVVGGLDLVTNPRADAGAAGTTYLGDLLLVRSYNASFANLAPTFPRDVALSLLAGALFAMARAASSGRGRDYVIAGVLLGLAGLTQADSFVVGLLAAALLAASAPRSRRLRTAAALLVPALALFSLWAVPLAVSYLRLGGFVDTTVVDPVVLPAWAILGAWGIVTPLALVGAIPAARSLAEPVVRVLAATLAAAAVVLIASLLAPGLVGEGFEAVARQHRYWPLFCLPLGILAGLGAHWLGTLLWERSRPAACVGAACVVGLAVPSPVIASLALPSAFPGSPSTRALEGEPDQALNVLSEYGDGICAAAVPRPLLSYSYTGFRFLVVPSSRREENDARIRWAEIYDDIVPQEQRVRDDELLMSGTATPEQFATMVERYGLDVVVVPSESASAEAFQGLSGRRVRLAGEEYVMFGVHPC